MTLVPLMLAGALTLEICVLLGIPMNFANIVALPLLLGIGVAFKIYYVVAWRAGRTTCCNRSLTQAIFFSALTTATAFGSLWLSSHPGTASMGKLLALSLLTTIAAMLLFQPALMGKPRDVGEWQISPTASAGWPAAAFCALRGRARGPSAARGWRGCFRLRRRPRLSRRPWPCCWRGLRESADRRGSSPRRRTGSRARSRGPRADRRLTA